MGITFIITFLSWKSRNSAKFSLVTMMWILMFLGKYFAKSSKRNSGPPLSRSYIKNRTFINFELETSICVNHQIGLDPKISLKGARKAKKFKKIMLLRTMESLFRNLNRPWRGGRNAISKEKKTILMKIMEHRLFKENARIIIAMKK